MKIAINATESFWRTLTGTGVYVRQLVSQLLALGLDEEFVLLGIRATDIDTSFVRPDVLRLLRSPRYRTVWSQLRLPLHMMRNRYDLLHLPEHKLPIWTPCRTVVTIHDLACMKFPETFRPMHRARLTWFSRDAVRRANRIIAVSNSTKEDICTLFGILPEKIDVVHHGVDHALFRHDVKPARRAAPYILSVGELQPRKNYSMLIRAFKQLCDRWRDPIELVIVGRRGWLWEPIEREASRAPYAERIHLLGYVANEGLAALYAGAAIVAMPSLYEGFGIPLVEAMACGAPLIVSDASSFPEIVGDAGILLDPRHEEAWTATMEDLLHNRTKRQQLRLKGLTRAEQFSWRRTAQETLAIYRKTIAQ
jgi:glycosyltransferase involved in cell wall biosynthesis